MDEVRRVRAAMPEDRDAWLAMRRRMFPDDPRRVLERELQEVLERGEHAWGLKQTCFVAEADDGRLVGFVEVNLRRFAEGCETRPVGYLEAWYVEPEWRRRGVGGRLAGAAETRAIREGCREMASDCVLDSDASAHAHRGLGYHEVHRIIHFAKRLA